MKTQNSKLRTHHSIRHYFRSRLIAGAVVRPGAVRCDAGVTIGMLSEAPRPALSWFERFISFLTTPFKRLGISGWKETGCDARGRGAAVRDAQHSTDGFWTIDVALSRFAIGALEADVSSPRFLRLEVEPGTAAHEIVTAAPVREGTSVRFGGAVVIDEDADFLEIHPDREFRLERSSES